jgi:hypothetical protein
MFTAIFMVVLRKQSKIPKKGNEGVTKRMPLLIQISPFHQFSFYAPAPILFLLLLLFYV